MGNPWVNIVVFHVVVDQEWEVTGKTLALFMMAFKIIQRDLSPVHT